MQGRKNSFALKGKLDFWVLNQLSGSRVVAGAQIELNKTVTAEQQSQNKKDTITTVHGSVLTQTVHLCPTQLLQSENGVICGGDVSFKGNFCSFSVSAHLTAFSHFHQSLAAVTHHQGLPLRSSSLNPHISQENTSLLSFPTRPEKKENSIRD